MTGCSSCVKVKWSSSSVVLRFSPAPRDIKGVEDLVKASPGKVEAVKLEVTSAADARAAASGCRDVSLLINNAGANAMSGALAASIA